jgi:hypothetical protein
MKQLVRQPAEWINRAPITVRAAREIIASPEEVWAVLTAHERWPEWFDAIKRAEGTGGDGVGSTRSVWFKKWRLDEEFLVWDEPKAFGFVVLAAAGPLGRLSQTLLERIDVQVLSTDRVRVTYLQGFDARSRVAARALKLASKGLRKALQDALDQLAAHVERERSAG